MPKKHGDPPVSPIKWDLVVPAPENFHYHIRVFDVQKFVCPLVRESAEDEDTDQGQDCSEFSFECRLCTHGQCWWVQGKKNYLAENPACRMKEQIFLMMADSNF